MSPKGVVLISGINGYIAQRTAKHFLEHGYTVRGTARRIDSTKKLTEGPLKEFFESGKFQVVEVPDITADGAFDEAVKDVTAIAHLASPVTFVFPDPHEGLRAAVHGTTSILNSALKAGPQLKTVVLMSSIAAVTGGKEIPYTYTENDWNTWAVPEVDRLGKETPGPIVYMATKAAGENAFWKFRDEKKPSFTMSAVNPVFVVGSPLIAPTTPEEVPSTTSPIFITMKGGRGNPLLDSMPQVVDVEDVAALTRYPIEHPSETDGERYIASSAVTSPEAYADILREAYPNLPIQKGTPGEGYLKGYVADPKKNFVIDASKAEKLLGGWIPFEKTVLDTAKAFEGLV